MIDKHRVFEREIDYITDEHMRAFVINAVTNLPDYFFTVSASSTSKYHPSYALGDGGLVRHTKAAVAIAKDLLSLEMYGKYSEMDRSCIISALILHDGMKHGLEHSQYTVAEHPIVVANWLESLTSQTNKLPPDILSLLTSAIKSHMGEFCTDYKTKKEILPKPKTAIQKFVHMCDYLASRKYLEFNFGDDYFKPEDFRVSDESIDPLKSTIENILTLCKQRVAGGADKESLFKLIADNNGGNKNPNSITNIDTAAKILQLIENDAA